MTFLASIIGAKLKYQPTTDQLRKRFSIAGNSKKDFQTFKIENKKRELILNELIPFPEQIDFDKLRGFKDEHFELLKAFKNKVELIVLNPTLDVDSELFSESINELKLSKAEVSAKMNESRLGKIFFGTIWYRLLTMWTHHSLLCRPTIPGMETHLHNGFIQSSFW
jgi:hypothetical protein